MEAHPENFEKMAENRPCAQNVRSAACEEEGGHLLFSKIGTGVSSAVDVDAANSITVPCRPMSSVFAEYNVTWIDFFSLDVEGHEAQVLSTIDFSKTQIGVILVERNRLGQDNLEAHGTKTKGSEVARILKAAGMIHVRLYVSNCFLMCIFVCVLMLRVCLFLKYCRFQANPTVRLELGMLLEKAIFTALIYSYIRRYMTCSVSTIYRTLQLKVSHIRAAPETRLYNGSLMMPAINLFHHTQRAIVVGVIDNFLIEYRQLLS